MLCLDVVAGEGVQRDGLIISKYLKTGGGKTWISRKNLLCYG